MESARVYGGLCAALHHPNRMVLFPESISRSHLPRCISERVTITSVKNKNAWALLYLSLYPQGHKSSCIDKWKRFFLLGICTITYVFFFFTNVNFPPFLSMQCGVSRISNTNQNFTAKQIIVLALLSSSLNMVT